MKHVARWFVKTSFEVFWNWTWEASVQEWPSPHVSPDSDWPLKQLQVKVLESVGVYRCDMNRLGTIISQKGRLKSNTLLQWKVSAGQSQFSSLNVDGSAHGDVSFIMLLSLITSLLTWMCHLNGKTGNELFSSLSLSRLHFHDMFYDGYDPLPGKGRHEGTFVRTRQRIKWRTCCVFSLLQGGRWIWDSHSHGERGERCQNRQTKGMKQWGIRLAFACKCMKRRITPQVCCMSDFLHVKWLSCSFKMS